MEGPAGTSPLLPPHSVFIFLFATFHTPHAKTYQDLSHWREDLPTSVLKATLSVWGRLRGTHKMMIIL